MHERDNKPFISFNLGRVNLPAAWFRRDRSRPLVADHSESNQEYVER